MEDPAQIRITAEPQPRPEQCLFRFDRVLYPGTLYTSDPAYAAEWIPLAAAIFELGGVRGVQIRHAELLITLEEAPQDWRDRARAVGAASRAFLQSGTEAVKEGATEHFQGDDLLRHQAQEVIDTRLNPGLAMHGGFVEIVDSQGGELWVNMGGGCQGCSSAAATMQQGVELTLRDAVPGLVAIHDATDHTAGANPYM